MTRTRTEFECIGWVRLGALSTASAQELARIGGEWLEYSPEEGAVVVRHVQPGGPPAPSAVPAELIAVLDALQPAEREAIPGGAIVVRDRTGLLLRVAVEGGEIRIQWPREDWSHAVQVAVDEVLRAADPFSSRISGTAQLAAAPGAETRLASFVEGFEGLYPTGDFEATREGGTVCLTLREVNVGPAQLLTRLHELADPTDSLEADLEIGSFVHHDADLDFRLTVRAGVAKAVRPALWRDR